MPARPLTLMFSAGEASSDMHAAHVLEQLQSRGQAINSFGMGAGKLAQAGMQLTVDCRELAVIGIVDVLLNYPKFMKRLAILRQALRERKPDLLVIVDYPDFNLKLAETARDLGIPVLFYISPQVWAWRHKRIKRIGSLVSHMAVLFPFEVDVYEQAGIPVTYVGHPLVDSAHSQLGKEQACDELGLDQHQPVVALLPGSRNGELSRHLPVMLETAGRLLQDNKQCQFVLPVAPTLDADKVASMILHSGVPVTRVQGRAYDVMRSANAVLSASGTATLETAMIGTPMTIMYVVNAVNYAIMRRLIRIENIGLVNIVAGKRIVEEFIQHAATPAALAKEIQRLLDDEAYSNTMRNELQVVQQRMGTGGASARVADLVLQLTG